MESVVTCEIFHFVLAVVAYVTRSVLRGSNNFKSPPANMTTWSYRITDQLHLTKIPPRNILLGYDCLLFLSGLLWGVGCIGRWETHFVVGPFSSPSRFNSEQLSTFWGFTFIASSISVGYHSSSEKTVHSYICMWEYKGAFPNLSLHLKVGCNTYFRFPMRLNKPVDVGRRDLLVLGIQSKPLSSLTNWYNCTIYSLIK